MLLTIYPFLTFLSLSSPDISLFGPIRIHLTNKLRCWGNWKSSIVPVNYHLLCSKIYFWIKRGTLKTSLRVSCVYWGTVTIEYSFVCLLHTRSGSFLRGDLTISAEGIFTLNELFYVRFVVIVYFTFFNFKFL